MGVSIAMHTQVVQRLRVTYAIDGPLKYVSVLDLGRLWERLLRRARIPLAYTQGFNPHPRLQLGTALPVGYSSACEILDVFLSKRMALLDFRRRTVPQSPVGLTITRVEEVLLKAAAFQATMRKASYRVRIWSPEDKSEVESALDLFLARSTVMRQRIKKGRQVDYDLRPLVLSMTYRGANCDYHELQMTLRCGAGGSGRPEEILDELGLSVSRYAIHRFHLVRDEKEET